MNMFQASLLPILCVIKLTILSTSASVLDPHPTPTAPNYQQRNSVQNNYGNGGENNYVPNTNNVISNNNQYGGYYQQSSNPAARSSILLRMYCDNRKKLYIAVVGGYSNVYCIRDREFLNTVMTQTLPSEGVTGNLLTAWLTAEFILQTSGYLPVCSIHCSNGKKTIVTPGNYTTALPSSSFSIGCVGIFSSECRSVCSDDVYNIDNGVVTCSLDTHVGSICQPVCNTGYTLVGPASKMCGEYLQWNSSEPFMCLADDVAPVIQNLMKYENLTVDGAMEQLRIQLETHLSKRPPPSTSRNGGANSEVLETEQQMTELLENLLIQLSKSTKITLKHYSVCAVEPKDRHDCGFPGITKVACQQKKCCWDESKDNTYWCFYTADFAPGSAPTKYTTKNPQTFPFTFNHLLRQGLVRPQPPQFGSQGIQMTLQPQHDFGSLFTSSNPATGIPKEPQCGCVSKLATSRCLQTGPATTSQRIFCGSHATANRWPWHAVVFHGKRLCGGTLISKNFVVTAAHCLEQTDGVTDTDPENEIYLGVTRRDSQDPGRQTRKMLRVIRHPLYHSRGNHFVQNDIALIQLSSPVDVTNEVRVLCLPGARMPIVGQTCYITGFGKQSPKSTASLQLLSASLPLISTAECSKIYNNKVNPMQNLCAGKVGSQSADACQGDSGGPLVCKDPNQINGCSWYLAGVTSFGKEPCGGGWPGVYVNVAHYQTWIQSHIQGGFGG